MRQKKYATNLWMGTIEKFAQTAVSNPGMANMNGIHPKCPHLLNLDPIPTYVVSGKTGGICAKNFVLA
jgi:hypothetical protein